MSKEAVNHPSHYGGKENQYEAIKVIEAWELGFCLGNTVKYISRASKKGKYLEDLKKAKWYLDRKISQLESDVSVSKEVSPDDICVRTYEDQSLLDSVIARECERFSILKKQIKNRV